MTSCQSRAFSHFVSVHTNININVPLCHGFFTGVLCAHLCFGLGIRILNIFGFRCAIKVENNNKLLTFVQNFSQTFSCQIGAKKKGFAGHEPNALKLVRFLNPPNDPGSITNNFRDHSHALDDAGIALAQSGGVRHDQVGRTLVALIRTC